MLELFDASVTERDATRCEFACLLWIQSYTDLRFDLVGFLTCDCTISLNFEIYLLEFQWASSNGQPVKSLAIRKCKKDCNTVIVILVQASLSIKI